MMRYPRMCCAVEAGIICIVQWHLDIILWSLYTIWEMWINFVCRETLVPVCSIHFWGTFNFWLSRFLSLLVIYL